MLHVSPGNLKLPLLHINPYVRPFVLHNGYGVSHIPGPLSSWFFESEVEIYKRKFLIEKVRKSSSTKKKKKDSWKKRKKTRF